MPDAPMPPHRSSDPARVPDGNRGVIIRVSTGPSLADTNGEAEIRSQGILDVGHMAPGDFVSVTRGDLEQDGFDWNLSFSDGRSLTIPVPPLDVIETVPVRTNADLRRAYEALGFPCGDVRMGTRAFAWYLALQRDAVALTKVPAPDDPDAHPRGTVRPDETLPEWDIVFRRDDGTVAATHTVVPQEE